MESTYSDYLLKIRQHSRRYVSLLVEKPDANEYINPSKVNIRKFAEGLLDIMGTSIMSTFDVLELSFVGSGSHGSVFDCGNGKMLKITDDESEFSNSSYLVNMDIPHVMRIYMVARMKKENIFFIQYKKYKLLKEQYPNLYDFYSTHEEKQIIPLGKIVMSFIKNDGVFKDVDDAKFDEWVDRKNSSIARSIVKDISEFVSMNSPFNKLSKPQRNAIVVVLFNTGVVNPTLLSIMMDDEDTLGKNFMRLFSNIIDGCVLMFQKAGIDFEDYHSDNIAVDDNGDFVLIDLGQTQTYRKPHGFKIIETKII